MAALLAIKEWIEGNEAVLQQVGTASLVLLVITLVVLPIVVVKLPTDYFTQEQRGATRQTGEHPLLWGVATLVKNLLGIVLIVAGLAMLVLPGQGTLTILIGLMLTNFPGKYAIERRIARQPAVGNTLNRIREWAGQPPLTIPTEAAQGEDSSKRIT